MFDKFLDFITPESKKQNYEINGKHQFHIEPTIRGKLPYQSSSVSITCYSDDSKRKPIDFICKWYRTFENRSYEMEEDPNAITYHVNPYDIGKTIKVIIKATDLRDRGVAELSFGPIQSDPALVCQMENNLIFGVEDMKVEVVRVGNKMINWSNNVNSTISVDYTGFVMNFDGFQDNLHFKFDPKNTTNKLKQNENNSIFSKNNPAIVTAGNNNYASQTNYNRGNGNSFDYNSNGYTNNATPLENQYSSNNSNYGLLNEYQSVTSTPITGIDINVIDNDPCAIEITFDYKETTTLKRIFQCDISEGSLMIKFESRFFRDNFLLTFMVAKTLRYMSVSLLSGQLEKILRDERPLTILRSDDQKNQQLFIMENLRRGLTNMIDINASLLQENKKISKAYQVLEEDTGFIIKDFSTLFEKLRNEGNCGQDNLKHLESFNRKFSSNSNEINPKKESDKETIARLEKELVETKKLNVLLMRKIEKNNNGADDEQNQWLDKISSTNNTNDTSKGHTNDAQKQAEVDQDTSMLENLVGDLEAKCIQNVNIKKNESVQYGLDQSIVSTSRYDSNIPVSTRQIQNLVTEDERKHIVSTLMTKTEDSYGEYVRELQGKNIGLTQENDNFANQKEKLESR